MRTQSFQIDPPAGLIDRARQELLDRNHGGGVRETSFRFGYLLGVENGARASLLNATRLDELLRERLLGPIEAETGRSYSLSFLKTTRGTAPPASEGVHYDGFHLDTHPEIIGEHGIELARVLINLAEAPRRLRFALTDRFALAKLGVPIHRGDYQVVELPVGIKTAEIEIPARRAGVVHGLRFWASVIPHVGADDHGRGTFLASYEALARHRGSA